MGRLDGKTAIVTGAARGQGEAEARLFAAEGANVLVCDILDDLGGQVAAELGGQGAYAHLDVGEPAQWDAAVELARNRFGGLDVLVNNAGVIALGWIEEQPREEFLRVLRVNQIGPWLGMKKAIPLLRAAGRGSIVNVSSTSGFIGIPGTAAYTASKFALRGLTRCAALELASDGIRVNSVHPGPIDTPMTQGRPTLATPLGRNGQPEEVARLVLFLASEESSYCTGGEYVVDGGLVLSSNASS